MTIIPTRDDFPRDAAVATPRFIYHATYVDNGGVWRDLIFRENTLKVAHAYALEEGRRVGMHLKFISRIPKKKGEIRLLTHKPFEPVPDFVATYHNI